MKVEVGRLLSICEFSGGAVPPVYVIKLCETVRKYAGAVVRMAETIQAHGGISDDVYGEIADLLESANRCEIPDQVTAGLMPRSGQTK